MFEHPDHVRLMALRNEFENVALSCEHDLISQIKGARIRYELAKKYIEDWIYSTYPRGTRVVPRDEAYNTEQRAIRERISQEVTREVIEAEDTLSEDYDMLRYRVASAFLEYLLQGRRIFLVGPNGQIVHVAHTILRTENYYQSGTGLGRQTLQPRVLATPTYAQQWCFLSGDTLAVAVAKLLLLTEAAQLLSESDQFQQRAPELKALRDFAERGQIAKWLTPYEGWPCSIKRADWPKRGEILGLLGQAVEGVDQGAITLEPVRRGRRRKIDDAATFYKDEFPNGHGSLTWKEVCQLAKEKIGLIVGTDTMSDAAKLICP